MTSALASPDGLAVSRGGAQTCVDPLVILTATPRTGEEYTSALVANGWDVEALDLLVEEHLATASDLRASWRRAVVAAQQRGVEAPVVVVTSRRGAAIVGRMAKNLTNPPPQRLYAPGVATAALLESVGAPCHIAQGCSPSQAICEAITQARPSAVWWARGEQVTRELRPVVDEWGGILEEIVVYRMRLDEAAARRLTTLIHEHPTSRIVVRSPRAARDVARLAPGATVVALGPTTAATARDVGLDVYRVAKAPTVEAVVAALGHPNDSSRTVPQE